tara:strand:- start:179 stop:421 length:243 start_codon:yes stop_codon:yes gene_type:complete
MSNDKQVQDSSFGRPWKIDSVFDNFEQADLKRLNLKKDPTLSVKIRRMADGRFTVRTRTPTELPSKKKGKRSSRNKKVSE